MTTFTHFIFFCAVLFVTHSTKAQVDSLSHHQRDMHIQTFLDQRRNTWTDFNVPYQDGQELYNLVITNKCTRVLEIGTSSGHSTIWLAKAVHQTGGKVITIEIDKGRYTKALTNFREANVADLIDARLGDAMQIIPMLEGTFDFVFSDATWGTQPSEGYTAFFKLCEPKLITGALYTMHNVSDGYGDDGRFFRYLDTLGNYQTGIIRKSSAGISVSKKMR